MILIGNFLTDNGLMDYSLLIGVRRKRFEVVDRDRERSAEGASSCLGAAAVCLVLFYL
jgi:hypothetical protein